MSTITLQEKLDGTLGQFVLYDPDGKPKLKTISEPFNATLICEVIHGPTGYVLSVTDSNGSVISPTSSISDTYTYNIPAVGDYIVKVEDSSQNELFNETVYIDGNGTYYIYADCVSTILDDNSWEIIKEVAISGTASDYWAVGDMKELSYLTIPPYYVFIIGFDHNKSIESSDSPTITFQLGKQYSSIQEDYLDSVLSDEYYGEDTPNSIISSGYYCMNGTGTGRNSGWVDSSMRFYHLNSDSGSGIFASRGELFEVYNYILPITKYTDNVIDSDGSDSNTSATVEKSFLLSPVELLGKSLFQPGGIYAGFESFKEIEMQEQYSYYLNHIPVKYIVSQNVTNRANYWTRSKRFTRNYTTCYYLMTGTTPTPIAMNDHYSYGIAPAFVIG